MYECQAFFPEDHPKKWKYVRDLKSFSEFLSKHHVSWKYFNVYEKGTRQFLKRFYQGNIIPKVLGLFLLLATLKLPYENTSGDTTYNTSINGFNYSATISTTSNQNGGAEC
jgi:hypothetical protein